MTVSEPSIRCVYDTVTSTGLFEATMEGQVLEKSGLEIIFREGFKRRSTNPTFVFRRERAYSETGLRR
jgi:hypothetical protein